MGRFEPNFHNSFAASWCPWAMAIKKGWGSTFVETFLYSNHLINEIWPNMAAICNGVNPLWFGSLISAPA